jgi:BASS family bile acid:Na+ symporter
MLQKLTLLFPFWMILAGAIALIWPEWLIPLNQGLFVILILAFIMLCMGLTLTFDDFRRITRMPREVAIGFAAQYSVMPLLGWGIAYILNLPVHFAVGLILVGCCPGGTASNLMSYIAKADVALSVIMTVCSTLAAVILTPLLTKIFAGTLVPVDTWMIFKQTLLVVILPVALGTLLNRKMPQLTQHLLLVAPLLSVFGICVICAIVFAAHAEAILKHGLELILAIMILHSGGFLLGYSFAWIFGCHPLSARTISIEVGMQNSGLSIILAKQAFPMLPLASVVGAISVLIQSLLASVIAVLWRVRLSRRKLSQSAISE